MYDDYLDIDDGEDSFFGEHIQSFKITVSDYSFPEKLVRIQDLLVQISELFESQFPDKHSQNQLVRSFVDLFWDLKPRPHLFTVSGTSTYHYLSLSSDDAYFLFHKFIKTLSLGEFTPSFPISSYSATEKSFFHKPSKLLRALFKEIEACEIMLTGSPIIGKFRECSSIYDAVVSIDLEAFEWSHDLLLELGIAIYYPNTNEIKAGHLLFKENSWRRNGAIVKDSKDDFLFGTSITLPQSFILDYLENLLKSKICLVGHAIKNDIDMLLKASDEFTIIRYIHTYDTQQIHKELKNKTDWHKLESLILEYMDEMPQALHNAGNDAVYTLQVFLAMAGIEPSDHILQLEIRDYEMPNISPKSSDLFVYVNNNIPSAREVTHSATKFRSTKNISSKYGKSKYL